MQWEKEKLNLLYCQGKDLSSKGSTGKTIVKDGKFLCRNSAAPKAKLKRKHYNHFLLFEMGLWELRMAVQAYSQKAIWG